MLKMLLATQATLQKKKKKSKKQYSVDNRTRCDHLGPDSSQ